jgi:hypothetical protein
MDQDLRRALIRAPANAIYVTLREPRDLIAAAKLIPRRDLTFVGPSILCEESLIEISRPVYVASDIAMTEAQRKALQWHTRRQT